MKTEKLKIKTSINGDLLSIYSDSSLGGGYYLFDISVDGILIKSSGISSDRTNFNVDESGHVIVD